MVDYDKASGSGTLRIRDLGSTIEFWVKPFYSDFWWENLDFDWTANGTTTAVQVDFSGNAWKKVGSRTVTVSTTVTFKLLEATGTGSLAGPTTHSVFIDRGTIPSAPDSVTFSGVTATTLTASFTDNGNGGLAIDSRQIGYAVGQPGSPTTIVASDGSTAILGLTAGTQYSFWSRVHNAKGYSAWSARSLVTMLRRPWPPTQVQLSEITQISARAKSTDGATGGSPITQRTIAYNTTNVVPPVAEHISWDNDQVLTNLPPGQLLYFWARSSNIYGASDWSTVATVTLIAGATIMDGATRRRAVPWVRTGGVWKVARPWGKTSGSWNRSAT